MGTICTVLPFPRGEPHFTTDATLLFFLILRENLSTCHSNFTSKFLPKPKPSDCRLQVVRSNLNVSQPWGQDKELEVDELFRWGFPGSSSCDWTPRVDLEAVAITGARGVSGKRSGGSTGLVTCSRVKEPSTNSTKLKRACKEVI